MNKRKMKLLYILVGVMVLAGLTLLVISRMEQKQEDIKSSNAVILSIDPDQVSDLKWTYQNEEGDKTEFSFHKDETGWHDSEDAAFPVNETKISELLSVFEDFSSEFIIEDVEDYSQYGLDQPEMEISVTENGKERTISLGLFSTMDKQRYVSIQDGKVYLASVDPYDKYSLTQKDLIQNDSLVNVSQIDSFEASGNSQIKFFYSDEEEKSYGAGDVYYLEDGRPLDTQNVQNYLKVVGALDLTNYATYDLTEEECKSFGLDQPEQVVSFEYTAAKDDSQEANAEAETKKVTFSLGRNPEALKKRQEKEEEEEEEITCYLRVGDSPIVYIIPEDQYEKLLLAGYNDFRHKELMTALFDNLNQIDVLLEGQTYTLTRKLEDNNLVWYYNGEEVDVNKLEIGLCGIRVNSFSDEAPGEKEEIKLTLHTDFKKFPEIILDLYRLDGSDCIAVVNGETVGRTDRSSVVSIMETIRAIVLNE